MVQLNGSYCQEVWTILYYSLSSGHKYYLQQLVGGCHANLSSTSIYSCLKQPLVSFTVKFLYQNSPPMIQGAPGSDMHKDEQTTLSKVCISAHKMGLLPPYTRDITHPPNRLTKITVMLLHWCMTPQNFVHHASPLGIITSYFFKFLILTGYLLYSLDCLLYSTWTRFSKFISFA